MRQPSPRGQRYYGAMTAGATGGLNIPGAGGAWRIQRTTKPRSRPPGACLSCDSPNFPRRGGPVRGSKWNTLLASGHPVQMWSKVERQHFRVLPFCVSPPASGKLVRIGTPFYIGGQIMAQTRTSYHKEVKTASFQGRTITVENLTPFLPPRCGTSASGRSRRGFTLCSASTRRAGRSCADRVTSL